MGLFAEIFRKKRCTVCGCYFYDDESDMCEICIDELLDSDPGGDCFECD